MGLLFTADAVPQIAGGDVTVTFRAWKRPQVKVGGYYRLGDLRLTVDALAQVRVGSITNADARRAGFENRAALLADLRGRGTAISERHTVWRVDFHVIDKAPDDRDLVAADAALSPDDVDDLVARLDRLDRASRHGPWTRATLQLIRDRPGVVSTDLAAELGRDRASFKLDVRKLKNLGLTRSREVGYELSPRGAALLASIGKRRGPHS